MEGVLNSLEPNIWPLHSSETLDELFACNLLRASRTIARSPADSFDLWQQPFGRVISASA